MRDNVNDDIWIDTMYTGALSIAHDRAMERERKRLAAIEATRHTPVLDLLRSKSRWCKGHHAISKKNRRVKPDSKKAHAFPLDIALSRCYPVHRELVMAYDKVLAEVHKLGMKFDFVSHFNDHANTDYALVKRVLEGARV